MIDPQQMAQMLQALHQRNNTQSAPPPNAQVPQAQAQPVGQGQKGMQQGGQPPSALGFLGGMMDGKTPDGGVDPSLLTQMNRNMLSQINPSSVVGASGPMIPGAASEASGAAASGGIMKLLSMFM